MILRVCVCVSVFDAYLFASLFARLFNHCRKWHVLGHIIYEYIHINIQRNE